MKNVTFTITILCCVFGWAEIKAQTTGQPLKKEIGIRLAGLSDFDFIFKKQKTENSYQRIRFLSSNLSISDFADFSSMFSIGVTIGKEKRKPLNNHLSLIRGWEIISSFSTRIENEHTSIALCPGAGLVFGFQYDINDNFLVTLETIPSITICVQSDSDELRVSNFNAGFNSDYLSLGLLYRF